MMMTHQTTSNCGGFPGIFRYQAKSFRQQGATNAVKHLAKGPVIPSVGDWICGAWVVSYFLWFLFHQHLYSTTHEFLPMD